MKLRDEMNCLTFMRTNDKMERSQIVDLVTFGQKGVLGKTKFKRERYGGFI